MEDANKRLIAMQEEQSKVNQALLEVLASMAKQQQAPDMNPSELLEMFVQKQASFGVVESQLPSLPKALPSKMELAKEWFRNNPNQVVLTGRELSEQVKPHGVYISHVTWNKAKTEV